MDERPPIHANRLEDGSQGAYRLRVCLWQGPGHKSRRIDAGLNTRDEKLAIERACYMLKGMLHFSEFMGVVAVRGKAYLITRDMVERWLMETGNVSRPAHFYGASRRRNAGDGTPPLPGVDDDK